MLTNADEHQLRPANAFAGLTRDRFSQTLFPGLPLVAAVWVFARLQYSSTELEAHARDEGCMPSPV